MKIFKIYIQDKLLDVITTKHETNRCYLIPSTQNVSENEHLRHKSEYIYIHNNKKMAQYFIQKLIKKGKIDKNNYSIDKLLEYFKKMELNINSFNLKIKIKPYSLHEVKIDLKIDNFLDDIIEESSKNIENKYILSNKNGLNIYIQVKEIY